MAQGISRMPQIKLGGFADTNSAQAHCQAAPWGRLSGLAASRCQMNLYLLGQNAFFTASQFVVDLEPSQKAHV